MAKLEDMLPLSDEIIVVDRLRPSDGDAHVAGTPADATLWWPIEPGLEAVRAAITRDAEGWRSGGAERYFAVRVRGALVGIVELRLLTPVLAEMSYWTYPAHRRRGYTARAVELVMDAATIACGIETVQVRIDAENVASLALASRLGFEEVERTGGVILLYGRARRTSRKRRGDGVGRSYRAR